MAWSRLLVVSVLALLGTLATHVAPAAAQKKISVLTWNIPVYKEKIGGWIADFKQIHPDAEVEWLDKKGTEWATFYQTQVAGGAAPDVIDVQGALWLGYAANGGLVDLTPYLAREPALRDWYHPKFLASFDELLDGARKMTKGERSGFLTLNFDWLYWPLFAMNGVDLLTPDGKKAAFNTPAAVKTVEALARATADGVINKISWTGRWVEPNGAFASGTVGFYQAHAPAFFYVRGAGKWVSRETLGVAAMPGGFSTPNSHGLGISKSSRHPELAWEFIKLVTGEKWASTFGTTLNNLTGTRADAKILDHFQKEDPVAAQVLRTQLEHLDRLVGTWPQAKDAQIKEAVYSELQAALLGQKKATDALAEAERKVNRLLQQR